MSSKAKPWTITCVIKTTIQQAILILRFVAQLLKPVRGINRRSWEEVNRISRQKFPEILVEPKVTTNNFGSSNSSLMQEMFPASPIYSKDLSNKVIDQQKTELLAKGVVDDGGHTFGKVDRSFTASPSFIELNFDISQLLDITPYWHISGSIKRDNQVKKYVPRPVKSITQVAQIFAEYEEGLICLNNATVGTITFNHAFSVAPYVVLTVEPTVDNQDNINVFGLTLPTQTGLLFGLSAPFTGCIRYRAAADSTYSWPRSAESVYTSSMTVYAGEHVIVNDNQVTSNFTFPSSPGNVTYLSTMYDAYFNDTANTDIELDQINNLTPLAWSADTHFSDYVTTKIHFLAFKV